MSVVGHRLAAGWSEGARRMSQGHDRERTHVVGQRQQLAQLDRERGRQRREGGAEPNRVGGQQQILHRGEDRCGNGGFVCPLRVATHHDEHGCGADVAFGAAVHVGEQLRAQSGLGMGPRAASPCPTSEVSDASAHPVVPHDHEHPGLGVLRARGERGRFEHLLDEVVGDGVGSKGAAGPLLPHDLEEIRQAVPRPGGSC